MPKKRTTSDVKVTASAPKTVERLEQMRKRFEALMLREPGAMIIFSDNGQSVEAVAIGSELDVRALYSEGTKALAVMMAQAHHDVDAPRPAKLDG